MAKLGLVTDKGLYVTRIYPSDRVAFDAFQVVQLLRFFHSLSIYAVIECRLTRFAVIC